MATRSTAIASASFDMLVNEYYAYLARCHDDSLAGKEELFEKMESVGYKIGRRFTERIVKDRERLSETLDVMKFICREFWGEVFRKPIDKLQTNNKGTFLLLDHNFRWTRYISGLPSEDTRAVALRYTVFCCGLIRGALSAFDMNYVVHVDVTLLPRVVFQTGDVGGSGSGNVDLAQRWLGTTVVAQLAVLTACCLFRRLRRVSF